MTTNEEKKRIQETKLCEMIYIISSATSTLTEENYIMLERAIVTARRMRKNQSIKSRISKMMNTYSDVNYNDAISALIELRDGV